MPLSFNFQKHQYFPEVYKRNQFNLQSFQNANELIMSWISLWRNLFVFVNAPTFSQDCSFRKVFNLMYNTFSLQIDTLPEAKFGGCVRWIWFLLLFVFKTFKLSTLASLAYTYHYSKNCVKKIIISTRERVNVFGLVEKCKCFVSL